MNTVDILIPLYRYILKLDIYFSTIRDIGNFNSAQNSLDKQASQQGLVKSSHGLCGKYIFVALITNPSFFWFCLI
jgi:hypothetical protein